MATALLAQPANDERENAVALTASDTGCDPFFGTTLGATGPDRLRDSCGFATNPSDDVWYTFTTPDSGDYRLTFRFLGGTDSIMLLEEVDTLSDGREYGNCISLYGIGDTYAREYPALPAGTHFEGRIYSTGDTTHVNYEICVEKIDLLRIAEGDGCSVAEPVFFDGMGRPGTFLDFRDSTGIIASIENTQPLGEVTVSFYDYNGPPRETEEGAIYLNRNISIVPETQPEDTVLVRLFLPPEDLYAIFDTGVISDDGQLAITKVVSSSCSDAFPGGGDPVDFRGGGTRDLASYIEIAVDGFSEFFIHPADQQLSTSVTEIGTGGPAWQLSPNPVGNQLRIAAPPELLGESASLEVYDAAGRRLLTRNFTATQSYTLDTSTLPRGLLSVVLTGGGQRVSARVVRR